MAETWALVAGERQGIADLLEALTPEQAATPSLCAGWSVRDVAAHLSLALTFSLARTSPIDLIKARGNPGRLVDALSERRAQQWSTAEIVGAFRDRAGRRWTPPTLPPEAPLTDLLVHGLDMRLPLGLEHRPEPEALARTLGFLLTPKALRGFTRKGLLDGLRFAPEDVAWSAGTGPEVTGPGLSMLSAMCGRPRPAEALGGAGAAELRRRLAS